MIPKGGEAMRVQLRTGDGLYIMRDLKRFRVTNSPATAYTVDLCPALVETVVRWRHEYGLDWTLMPADGDGLPLDVAGRILHARPDFPERVPDHIRGEDDCRRLVRWFMHFCGMGFHPDTAAGEYVDCDSGRATFEGQFAELVVQPLLDDAFELLGDRVYEIGMEEFRAVMTGESGTVAG